MNREQTITTMTLMGWFPIHSDATGRTGVFNPGIGRGLVCRQPAFAVDSGYVVKIIEAGRMADLYDPAPWDVVTDWHLAQIVRVAGFIQ